MPREPSSPKFTSYTFTSRCFDRAGNSSLNTSFHIIVSPACSFTSRSLLIKFSADIILPVFPSGSSCCTSLIAAEGPKFEENNKLREKKWKRAWLEATGEEGRRWLTGRAPVTLLHHHFYLLSLFLRLSSHLGLSQLGCCAAARWELNLTSDFFRLFRWCRIAALAFLISSLTLVLTRSSFPSAASSLPPDTSTSHSHYLTVSPQSCPKSCVFSLGRSDAAIYASL